MSLNRGSLRVWRGLGLATACLIIPVAGHVAGGGHRPAIGPMLLIAAILSTACVATADRQHSVGDIAGLMLVTQPALHVLLTISSHGAGGSIIPTWSMAVGHIVAAGILTILLAGAEAVLWTFAALLDTVLLTLLTAILSGPRIVHARSAGSRWSTQAATYIHYASVIAPTRGPPPATASSASIR